MPSPFHGMDPYLEHHDLWPSVHTRLIAAIDETLGPQLPPRYYTSIEERFYVAGRDDPPHMGIADVLVAREREGERATGANGHRGVGLAVPAREGSLPGTLVVEIPTPGRVRQRYLEIRMAGTHEVVTVIEVLSPTNKTPGEGRRQYEAKRQATLDSYANLVEIDLLRAGQPLPMRHNGQAIPIDLVGDYRVLISRAPLRPQAELLVSRLPDPFPVISIPLRAGEPEPQIALQDLVRTVYARGSYERRIDYTGDPDPPLAPDIARWADRLLRERGLR